jgi:hypothetical protein
MNLIPNSTQSSSHTYAIQRPINQGPPPRFRGRNLPSDVIRDSSHSALVLLIDIQRLQLPYANNGLSHLLALKTEPWGWDWLEA